MSFAYQPHLFIAGLLFALAVLIYRSTLKKHIISGSVNVFLYVADRQSYQSYLREARQLCDLKSELRQISAMDEFARWAKLNRTLTNRDAEFQKLHAFHQSRQGEVELKLKLAFKAVEYLLLAILSIIYRSDYVMEDPDRALWPFTYLLSFPFSPSGTVSVVAWYSLTYAFASIIFNKLTRFY